ncbi:GATA zinc finger domain-containing protein 13-like [Aphidius gifuensis]|nr:GATA zinc finger domain-containing protein 13-like [Aphidius gifuensis]
MMMIKSSSSLDEDDTITSSMTNMNNQDVDEKSSSLINEKNNTKSKEKLVNQLVISDDDESSDSSVDQVSSTQSSQASKHLSGCLISNGSVESTPINKTESDLDEDSSSKPQALLVRNPFFKKKNKQADSTVDNNKSREIKKEIDDEDSKQMDNTSDIEEKKYKAKKYPPEKLDDHLDNTKNGGAVFKQSKNGINNLLLQPDETLRNDAKFVINSVKKERQDIDSYKFKNGNCGGSKVHKTEVKELDETSESLDLLNPKNNINKKLLLMSKSSDDEYDDIDNKKNTDVKIKINSSDYKDNIDTGDTPEDNFCDSITEMSTEEVHSPDLFGSPASINLSPVCSTKKSSKTKQENHTSKQASTDEDPSVFSDSQDKNETSKISVKKDESVTEKKLNDQLSSDEENNEHIITRKKINYHKNIKAKISIENEKEKIVANKNPLSKCLSPTKSNQMNCQDLNDQSSSKCTQQKKETNKRLNKSQRMIGNCLARVVDVPLSSSEEEDSTPTKRARYSDKKKSRQSDTKSSSSSSDNDNKSKKSNSSFGEPIKGSSDNDNENKPCSSTNNKKSSKKSTSNHDDSSSEFDDNNTELPDDLTAHQVSKIQHNQEVAKKLNIEKKSTKNGEAWLDGTKLCFSTDSLEKRRLPNGERRKEFLKWEQNEMIRFVYDNDKFRHSRSKSFWKQLSATDLFSHRTPVSLVTHWIRKILQPEYIENSGLPKQIKEKFLYDSEYRKLKAIYDHAN